MRLRRMAAATAFLVLAACGGGDGGPSGPGGSALGSVRGSVTDQTGAAVVGASVALTASGQTTRNTNTGSDGSYSFGSVAAGAYTLAVTPPAGYSLGTSTGIAAVTVVAGQQASVAAIVLSKSAPGGPAPALADVAMVNTSFNPQQVEVAVGGTVRFTNNDSVVHNATGDGVSTGNMNPGQSREQRMNTAGTFSYSCTLHSGMTGSVVVR